MKTKCLIFFILVILGIDAKAAAPYGIKGQKQSATLYSNVHQFPNNQVTNVGGINAYVETGNKNLLADPSFEKIPFEAGTPWNTGFPLPVTEESSTVIDGRRVLVFNTSSQTINLSQSSTLYAGAFSNSGVQCLATVRINSTHSGAISVCSIQAGTVSTTNCVNVNADSKWGLYKIPFICGATSNGISIVGASGTGTTYVDDAFVGTQDLIQDAPIIGPWTSYTPTFTGLGTVTSINFKWRQSGQNIEIQGYAVAGTATAAQLTFTLPNSYTSSVPVSNTPVGVGASGYVSTTYDGNLSVFATPSSNLLTVAGGTTTTSPFSGNANFFFTSGQSIALMATVPVTGLSGSTSTYSSQCGANCIDTFSAKISSGGVVSGENVDWISGNCGATSPRACTFNSNIFTVAPNCTATTNENADHLLFFSTAVSASGFTLRAFGNTNIDGNSASMIVCQKQGADFTASRTIQGTFKEVMVATGVTKPKTCYYAFGGAAATLSNYVECTTGTCIEVYDSCGTATPPTFTGSSDYLNLTFANGTFANSSYIHCSAVGFDLTSASPRVVVPYWDTSDNSYSTNSSGGYVMNMIGYTGAGANATVYVSLKCEGSAP